MEDTDSILSSWALALHDHQPSTRRLYADILQRFARSLPVGVSLLEATRTDVRAYFASLQAEGLSRSTIRSRWIALRSFYGWAVAEDEIDTNPLDGVKVEKADPPPAEFPSDDELAILFKSLTGRGIWERRDLAMIRLAAATGLRLGELCSLKVADIDLARGVAYVRHGKGDKARLVTFDDKTGHVLDRYVRERGRYRLGDLPDLWLSRFGPYGIKGAQHMIRRRCEAAGIPVFHWHQLRHRFAHTLLERGGTEGSLARLGGWSDPAVMRRYGASRATERALSEYRNLGGVL